MTEAGPAFAPESLEIETVYLVFKTHLDVGFTDMAGKVKATYFNKYIPRAIELAEALRAANGEERFVWTTGSWIIYEYLEQAALPDRRRLEIALAAGDIVWHGLPFTTHSELLDPSLFEYGLSLSQQLDRRFGRTTGSAKMTDVPGHTRGIVPLLAGAGIKFLHIGVNPASTPPAVPPLFTWRDPASQTEIVVMYQAGSYGDLTVFPGHKIAVSFEHTEDNLGPQTRAEVLQSFNKCRQKFPGAQLRAATLDDFASVLCLNNSGYPVITAELGDSWIHGAGTDPLKIGQFRELSRCRRRWLDSGPGLAGDPGFENFSRYLLQVPEHTWGLDEKTFLADYSNYTNEQLAVARRQQTAFQTFEASWQEQRDFIPQSLAALETTRPDLAAEARQHLAALRPARPAASSYEQQAISGAGREFETAHFELGFNPQTGALDFLRAKKSGREWASPSHPLGAISFEVFSQADYDRFWRQYVQDNAVTKAWAIYDFTKPGITAAVKEHREWSPRLLSLASRQDAAGQHFLLEYESAPPEITGYGCPRLFTLELFLPEAEAELEFNLQWFDKQASRLPMALWFSFVPLLPPGGEWRLDKLGSLISPLEVIANGNRHLHGIGQGAFYRAAGGTGADLLKITSLDAALLAPGRPALLDFNNDQPDLSLGMHFNLYNNVWGTNFPMWYEDDTRFRFKLAAG